MGRGIGGDAVSGGPGGRGIGGDDCTCISSGRDCSLESTCYQKARLVNFIREGERYDEA